MNECVFVNRLAPTSMARRTPCAAIDEVDRRPASRRSVTRLGVRPTLVSGDTVPLCVFPPSRQTAVDVCAVTTKQLTTLDLDAQNGVGFGAATSTGDGG
jgi:hypothetical protein